MILLELEEELERALRELGICFGDRVYPEEVRYAAQIDDITTPPISLEQLKAEEARFWELIDAHVRENPAAAARRAMDEMEALDMANPEYHEELLRIFRGEPKEGSGLLLAGLHVHEGDMTENQLGVLEGDIPFISRKSGVSNGRYIEYKAYPLETLEEYRNRADQLVTDNQILYESIDICCAGTGSKVGYVDVLGRESPEDPINIEVGIEMEHTTPLEVERIHTLTSLKGKVYELKKICDAAIAFLDTASNDSSG